MPPAQMILLYVVLPVWLLFGIADWWCHRISDIEHTAGAKESMIHIIMYSEGGAALLAGLFLEINAAILVLFFILLIAHEITATWDLMLANSYRKVTVLEQRVHSFLEVLPFLALSLVCVLYWPQFMALFGIGEKPIFRLEWKHQPLPTWYTLSILGAAVFTDLLAYSEELIRCLSVKRQRKRIALSKI